MDKESFSKSEPRLRWFYVLFGCMFLYLLSGLVWVQLIEHQEYAEKQEQQNYRRILIPGPRGDIYDREGRLLVGNRPLFSAVVYLNELRKEFRAEYFLLVRQYRDQGRDMDRSEVAIEARRRVVQRYLDMINEILGKDEIVEPRDIERHFSQQLLLPLPLQTDLTPGEYARLIEQLPIDGPIQIIAESARHYPFGRIAAHTLGFVVSTDEAIDGDSMPGDDLRTFKFKDKAGRTGIERSFDEQLQGTAGGEIWIVDPSGFQHERIEHRQPVKGQDVYLSLDLDLQLAAEEAMNLKTGAVVAMDVLTGEVLVMASEPAFDLNDLTPYLSYEVDADIRARGAWINRAIQGLYPPGSTFKLVTAIAGEMEGMINGETVIHCPGYFTVGRRNFPCHNRAGHGDQNLEEAIANSCNVYFYQTGIWLGIERLAAASRMLRLDQPTGVELPGETSRMVVPDAEYKKRRFNDNWYPGDTANTSIGQGFLLTTPLQMCAFTASLARGESYTTPTLLRRDKNYSAASTPLPLTQEQLMRIREGMRMAATQGTARLAQVGGFNVAGKTGTAQVPIDGRMSTLAWFVGYAPQENPQIAVCVMIEGTDPYDQYHGGSTAAPIARQVFKAYAEKHLPQQPQVSPQSMAGH